MKSDQSKTKNQLLEEINNTRELISEVETADLKRSHMDSFIQPPRIPVKWGISKKTYIGFGIVGTILACAIIIFLNSIISLNTNIKLTHDHPLVVTRSATLIEVEIVEMHRSMKDVTLAENDEIRNQYNKKVTSGQEEVIRLFDIIHMRILGEAGQELAANVHETFLGWEPIRQRVIALAKSGNNIEAQRITQTEGQNYVDLLITEVEELVNYAANKAMVLNKESSAIANSTRSTALILFSLTMVFGAILTYFITRDITSRLDKINQAALKMTEGNLKQVINIKGSDELSHVADSFNIMANQLSRSYESLAEKVEIRTRELKESEEKYKTLFERESDAIFIYDPDTTNILDANQATSIMYGYNKTELIGMSCLKFSAEIKESASSIDRIHEAGEVHVPIRYHQKKDGTVFPVDISGYSIKLGDKNVLFAVSKNITERKQAEDELQRSLEERDKELTTQAMFMAQRKEFLLTIIAKLQQHYATIDTKEKSVIRQVIYQLEKQVTPGREWDEFEIWFREVHKNFYRKLTEKYPDLSPRELKICAFLKLNLSSKEIASLTNLTVKTIEVYRSQLRKKLNVLPGVNLIKFISEI